MFDGDYVPLTLVIADADLTATWQLRQGDRRGFGLGLALADEFERGFEQTPHEDRFRRRYSNLGQHLEEHRLTARVKVSRSRGDTEPEMVWRIGDLPAGTLPGATGPESVPSEPAPATAEETVDAAETGTGVVEVTSGGDATRPQGAVARGAASRVGVTINGVDDLMVASAATTGLLVSEPPARIAQVQAMVEEVLGAVAGRAPGEVRLELSREENESGERYVIVNVFDNRRRNRLRHNDDHDLPLVRSMASVYRGPADEGQSHDDRIWRNRTGFRYPLSADPQAGGQVQHPKSREDLARITGVAAFDFDGTLFSRDHNPLHFLLANFGSRRVITAAASVALHDGVHGAKGFEVVAHLFKDMPAEEFAKRAKSFARPYPPIS